MSRPAPPDWIVAMFFLTCHDQELNRAWFLWLFGYEMAVQAIKGAS